MVSSASSSELGTIELVQRATHDARELIRLEVALAKNELGQDLTAVKSSAIFGAIAIVCLLTALASCLTALGLLLGPLAALAFGILLLTAGVVFALVAYRRLPKGVLAATGQRMKTDESILKEHLS